MNNAIIFRNRIFVVIGLDFFQRQRAIDTIKARVFHDNHNTIDSLFILYGNEIELKDFKDLMLSSSFPKERMIIVKNADNLDDEFKEFVLSSKEIIMRDTYCVFEIERDIATFREEKKVISDKFYTFLFQNATLYKLSTASVKTASPEDFKWSIRRKDYRSAILIVEKLLFDKGRERDLGAFFLGILVYEISSIKDISKRQKYLNYLLDTDRLIKEKGVTPRLALQLLLARLAEL